MYLSLIDSEVMHKATTFLLLLPHILSGLHAASANGEEDQDNQDIETGKDVFILKSSVLDSCVDIPWDDFERALDEFTPVKSNRRCSGGANQLLQFRYSLSADEGWPRGKITGE